MLRTSVVMDYQNVHLTARDLYGPDKPTHESLIHPVQFAARAIQARNSKQRAGFEHAQLAKTLVFRGQHHVDYDWEQNRRSRDQAEQWKKDGADVELRDLKYRFQMSGSVPAKDIHGKKIPIGSPQEKGIDVLCALACLREAAKPDVDLVILASRDTDLVPVLDELYDLRGSNPATYARIETVAWFDRSLPSNYGNLRPTAPRQIWNTNLDRSCYDASIDRTNYR